MSKFEDAIETPPSEALQKAAETSNPLRKLYFWSLHWAGTKFALPALCLISFAEASFFPVPPDALLLPMCFSKPKKWLSYALWCTLFSVLGAVAGWLIGYFLWHFVSAFFFKWIPGFTPEKFNAVATAYQQWGFWIILAKGLTPIPFKIITISAGACQVSLPAVIGASVISRGARFIILALLVRIFGEKAKPFIEKYLPWILLGSFVLLVLGIFSVKLLPGHH